MSTIRVAARRGQLCASARVRARLAASGRSGDAGFTMVEMMVALIIIAIIMTALGTFFVNTVSATSRQGSKQVAIQLADDGIEKVRALQGSAVLDGRDKSTSDTQWNAPAVGVAAYQTDMTEAWDTTATTGDGTSAVLPTVPQKTTVNGLDYYQNWYIGYCYQPVGGGSCGASAISGYVQLLRVVVAVTWSDKACTSSACSYIASTLVSNAATDPTFISSLSAQPPTIVNPGNQVNDITVPLTLTLAATGGAGAITWAAVGLPAGLTMSTSGVISGTPTAINTYSVTVTATDSFNLPGTAAFTWTINALPTVNNPGTRNDGVGSSVSYTASLTGGTGSVAWSATGLPAGLTINASTGTISGTPTGAGTSSVVLKGTDSLNQSGSATFTWNIYAALQVTTPADQTSNLNVTITNLTVAATGGLTPYSWGATGLPTGLSINSSGVISGKPTVAGVYTVQVTVSDSDGNSASTSNFKWTVVALTITNPTNALSSTKGIAITPITAAATGGTGTGFVWSVVSGSPLPAGVTINASTGVISGTPTTVATYSVNLKVTDSGGNTDTQAFTWTINTTPSITTPTANQANTAGTAIASITAVAAGGTPAYTWSATGLPTGVTIDATSGVISGTPSAAGSYATVVKVTDASGATDTNSLTWTVNAALNITNPVTNQASTSGKAIIAITAAGTGGTGTKTWSATGLPTGISISSAGSITGTPSAAGSYSVSIKVTDSVGATDTQAITWTVNAALNITSPAAGSTISTVKNTNVTVTPSVTGGTGAITWSVTGLPTGLTLNTATGVMSGKTANTVATFTVKLTASDSLGATTNVTFTWKVTN